MRSHTKKNLRLLPRAGKRFCNLPSLQNRIGWINHAIFDHYVDVRSILDVANWIRLENDEVGKMALLDLANMRTGFAAE
jgi:hypothetical protein